jgi:hypothetical protein
MQRRCAAVLPSATRVPRKLLQRACRGRRVGERSHELAVGERRVPVASCLKGRSGVLQHTCNKPGPK